jgi:hypothetical protein
MRPDRDPNPEFTSPEARRPAVAEILARGVRRHLSTAPPSSAFSAGRSLENPSDSSGSELALLAEKSVTVPPG